MLKPLTWLGKASYLHHAPAIAELFYSSPGFFLLLAAGKNLEPNVIKLTADKLSAKEWPKPVCHAGEGGYLIEKIQFPAPRIDKLLLNDIGLQGAKT